MRHAIIPTSPVGAKLLATYHYVFLPGRGRADYVCICTHKVYTSDISTPSACFRTLLARFKTSRGANSYFMFAAVYVRFAVAWSVCLWKACVHRGCKYGRFPCCVSEVDWVDTASLGFFRWRTCIVGIKGPTWANNYTFFRTPFDWVWHFRFLFCFPLRGPLSSYNRALELLVYIPKFIWLPLLIGLYAATADIMTQCRKTNEIGTRPRRVRFIAINEH